MNTLTIIIAGCILLIAIVVAFLLANRRSWRSTALTPKAPDAPIEHYTKIRDKLTLNDAGIETTYDSTSSSLGSGMFMEIAIAAIGIGVVVMVGYLVLENVKAALPDVTNATTLMGSTTMTITSGFALVAVGIIVIAAFGLLSIFKD